jgi:hypothetical protein
MDLIQHHFQGLDAKQKEQYSALPNLYQHWNDQINVISRKDIPFLAERHVLHSLAIAKIWKPAAGNSVLDIGTGGGFPGIPLAIMFPDVQFYDYTKINNRKVSHIPNYHLTFSKADGNDMDVRIALSNGMNVAAVFHKVPETYLGRQVIDGDETDLRFLDPKGVIVGLKAKGKAKKDTTGFVV